MNKIKVLLITILLLSSIIAGGVYFYTNHNVSSSKKAVDYYDRVSSYNYYIQGNTLRSEGKYEEAVTVFTQGLNTATSTADKSVFDVAIGVTKFAINKEEGVSSLIKVANNESYPNVSRAFAFQYAYQMYLGYRDSNLLKPFLTDEEFKKIDFSKPIPNEIIGNIHEKIYTLSPLPLTRARLAFLAWQEKGAEAQPEIDERMRDFENSVKATEEYRGMASLLPPAYLVAAVLAADMKQSGVAPMFGQPEHFFEEAFTRANIGKIESTAQFALLGYADYLVSLNDTVKAKMLLNQLIERGINPMIKATVISTQAVSQYTNLINLAKKDSEMKILLQQIGFQIK